MSGVEVRPLSRLQRTRDPWVVLGLIALAVGLPAIVGLASGSISIAHNDDFAYRRAALTLYQTGRLELTGWAVMTLVGLLVVTQPLLWLAHGGAWAFAGTTAIFAVVGVVASYALARRVLSPGPAGLSVLMAILVPGYLLYTTAYMTEVPAIATEIACLAIGAAALRRSPGTHRWRWLAASLAVGCYAFSIREYALAAPIAVLVAAAASDRQRRVLPYAFGLLAVAGACLSIYVYTAALPGQDTVGFKAPTPGTIRRVLDSVGVLSFALAPALVIAVLRWVPRWRRSRQRLGAALGGLAGAAVAAIANLDRLPAPFGGGAGKGPDMFVGNVFTAHGTLDVGLFAGDRPVLYPAPAWELLNAVALVATFAACAFVGAFLVAERHRLRDALEVGSRPTPLGSVPGMVAVFIVIFGAGTLILGLTVILFDRYTWPLALPLAILLLLPPVPGSVTGAAGGGAIPPTRPALRAGAAILCGGLVAVIGTSSVVLLLNAAAFDAARWRMGDAAVRMGFAADTVDAGFEWVGSHATGLAELTAPRAPSMTEYSVKFPSFHQCAVASSSPLDFPGFTLILTRPDAYRLLLAAGPAEPLYLYRVAGDGCPAGP